MSPWVQAPWLPWALLLIHIPGCVSLRGPGSVNGIVGGSLSVRCTYEQEDENNSKYWCESSCVIPWDVVVKTSETQREARRGHVTIRDEPENLTFTVTLENLTEANAGTYWCGVLWPIYSKDLVVPVVVSVFPAFPTALHAASSTPGPHLEPAEPTQQEPPDLPPTNDPGSSGRGSLLSSVHCLLLIFLKVPLLLGMMGAVLWASWPRRGPRQADSAV
ncbi:CMRF35-like molecule 6 [Sorex araneus]|uniref:CMRF35-like molecule 6 n=1 Tax=Sorex araneus TaxID=42254 RepID=UPI0024338075|nr:CMRF35-like molecule 6 [Sorex araneus]